MAILALPTAIGLLFVALILQQGWPSVVGGPLPAFAPEPPAEEAAPALAPASSGGAALSPQLRIDALLQGTRPAGGGGGPGASGGSHRVADASPVSSSPAPTPSEDIPETPAVPPAVVETPPPSAPSTPVASPPATETSPTVETPVSVAATETTDNSSRGRGKAVGKDEERRGKEAGDDDAEDGDEAKAKPTEVSVPLMPSKPEPVAEAPSSEGTAAKRTDKPGRGYGREKFK